MSVYCQGEYLHYPLLCCLKVDNHEVAAMYLPWTAELCWPLARSFENEELRTSSWFTAERCCSGHATERTNERTIWTILPAELTDRNWTSTSSDEIQLCFIVVLPDYRRFCGAVKMKRNVSFCKTFSASSVSDVTISDSKRKELSFRLKKQIEVVTLVINRETNQQLQLWCYYNVVFVVYLYISGSR